VSIEIDVLNDDDVLDDDNVNSVDNVFPVLETEEIIEMFGDDFKDDEVEIFLIDDPKAVKTQRRRRCYHEAGHAVAALALGCEVDAISDWAVVAWGYGDRYDEGNENQYRKAIVLMAGCAAESIQYKEDYYPCVNKYSGGDLNSLCDIMIRENFDLEFHDFYLWAREILEPRWKAVEYIVQKLLSSDFKPRSYLDKFD